MRAGVTHFLFNYTGFLVCQPDFYFPQWRTVVECDGAYWHSKPKQQARDRQKDRFYHSKGLFLFRFPEAEITKDADGCVRHMLTTLGLVAPPLHQEI